MEKDENKESSDGTHGPGSGGSRNGRDEGGAVIAEDDSVVGDAYNGEHEENHDGSETPQRRTELEDVPRHYSARSMHRFAARETESKWKSKSDSNGYSELRFGAGPFSCSLSLPQLGLALVWISWGGGRRVEEERETQD